MSFLASLFSKPTPLPHVIIKHVVATRAEDKAAQAKRVGINLQLAVYRELTTPAQRKAEADAYFTAAAIERAARKL